MGTNSLKERPSLSKVSGKSAICCGSGAQRRRESLCDRYLQRTKRTRRELGCDIVDADDMFEMQADIYAPCALGASINDESL
ncbi:MAG: hypothetical protein U5K84_06130 [Alkalibacterium sp.]|nr:hypothetical protein [Alkalibacterium sp.]